MPLILRENKLLLAGGKLATSLACCCGTPFVPGDDCEKCVPGHTPRYLYATITGYNQFEDSECAESYWGTPIQLEQNTIAGFAPFSPCCYGAVRQVNCDFAPPWWRINICINAEGFPYAVDGGFGFTVNETNAIGYSLTYGQTGFLGVERAADCRSFNVDLTSIAGPPFSFLNVHT